MTTLTKKLRRSVPASRTPLVIQLEPLEGDALIELRERGRRKGFAITAQALYIILAKREADRIVRQKIEDRKAKRKAARA